MKQTIIVIGAFLLSVGALAKPSVKASHDHHPQKKESAVKVEIGKKGFISQSPLIFKPNEKIVLNITRTIKKTCMTELKHPKSGELVKLPMNKEVRFEIGSYKKATEIKLLCGMGMKAGVIYVKDKPSKS